MPKEYLDYNHETMSLSLPTPESVVVGSNALSVIDLNGTVYQPLEDITVKVTLKLEHNDLKEYEVTVSGRFTDQGINKKPIVVPALSEWHGLEGIFPLNQDTIISSQSDVFNKVTEMFINDLADMGIELIQDNQIQKKNKVMFEYNDQNGFYKEGYGIIIKDQNIVIQAAHHVGAFYATRSLLQILKTGTKNQLPNGYIRDYPKYAVRSFVLDVGRKFTKLDYIYELMKTMSYYKINDFQIHLNDNSFLEFYEDAEEALKKGYPGFRLESDLEGNGHTLTSKDGFYTKEEFRNLISNATQYGVTIVPEFDTPGHALSFVKLRPDLMFKGEILNGKVDQERAAMLDLDHPDTLDFVKSMYNEFLDGDDPVIKDVPVHIGCDEYYGEADVYRKFVDELLTFIRDEKGRTPRVWGSLTNKAGTTPITSDGVQLHAWNTGWSEPNEMIDLGYDIINIEDHQTYLVPGADYYHDYLDAEKLFHEFEPNEFNNGAIIDESHPQLIGAGFALWNDQVGYLENGITSYDMFDRIFAALPILSQKFWGSEISQDYDSFKNVSKLTAYAPQSNPRFSIFSKSETILDYDFTKEIADQSKNNYDVIEQNNISFNNGVLFNGTDSYLELPFEQIGPETILTVELELNQVDHKQILLETDSDATICAVNETGYIGYQYENNIYSFEYKLKPNEKKTLKFVTSLHHTTLFVNDKEIKLTEETSMPFTTLVLPLKRIGGKKNTLDGKINQFKLERRK